MSVSLPKLFIMSKKEVISKNKRASFEYEFIDKYVAGIQLTGSEIKSIRNKQADLSDSHCILQDGELWIRNMHIAPYNEASYNNHEPKRERKLLLNRNELKKIEVKLKDVGITLIPTQLFISSNGYAKLEIALARGKKLFDKRDSIKEKDIKRQMDRSNKGGY